MRNGYLLVVFELQDKPFFKDFYQFLAAGLNYCRICPNTFKARYFSKPAAVIKLFVSRIFNGRINLPLLVLLEYLFKRGRNFYKRLEDPPDQSVPAGSFRHPRL